MPGGTAESARGDDPVYKYAKTINHFHAAIRRSSDIPTSVPVLPSVEVGIENPRAIERRGLHVIRLLQISRKGK